MECWGIRPRAWCETIKLMSIILLHHLSRKTFFYLGMFVHSCNPSNWEVKTEDQKVQSQPYLLVFQKIKTTRPPQNKIALFLDFKHFIFLSEYYLKSCTIEVKTKIKKKTKFP